MYTTIGWIHPTRITYSHLKRIIGTNFCIHKLCIKVVFLYTIISRCRSTKHKKVTCLLRITTYISMLMYI